MTIAKKSLALLLLGTTLTSCVGNVNAQTSTSQSAQIVKENAVVNEVISRQSWMDKMFYSINKDVQLDAPIWINEESKKNEYGSIYMKTLIQEAHQIAKRYLKYGDHEAYNSFMMLALTFPMHEGLYMSFRQTNDEKGLCYRKANNGDIMFEHSKKKIFEHVNANLESEVASSEDKARLEAMSADEEGYRHMREQMVDDYTRILLDEKKERIANTDKASNYRHFIKYLKSGETPFIADCDNVANDQVIRQIIRGADGTDIGPVQLSLRWHYDKYLAKKMYLSLKETFKYGLNFIHVGFKKAYYDADKVKGSRNKTKKSSYSCLVSSDKSINYTNLVRGTWAGKYNQGQIKKACRIMDVEKLERITKAEEELKDLEGKFFKNSKTKKKISALKSEISELKNAVGNMSLKRHPDYHFKNNLNKVIKFIDQDKIGYGSSLSFKLDAKTKAAVDEIVKNFNSGNPKGSKHSAVSNL